MDRLHILNASEQVAQYLRGRLVAWRRVDHVPGVIRLAKELGVGKDTVEAALRQLEAEGLLEPQGRRKRRKVAPGCEAAKSTMQISILDYDLPGETAQWVRDLRQGLVDIGLKADLADVSLEQLGMSPVKVHRMLSRSHADAWVVLAATKEVLEVFMSKGLPVLAVAGAHQGLPIPSVGPDMHPALEVIMKHLFTLGHQRISFVTRQLRRGSEPIGFEKRMLEIMRDHGIATGPYNLPSWNDQPDDLSRMLENLFSYTPPTALIIDEPSLFISVQHFLLNRGFRVPEDVSLICTEHDPFFSWCRPTVSHINWDLSELINRVRRWARNTEKGIEDLKKVSIDAEYIMGGTVAKANPIKAKRPLTLGGRL